MTAGSPWELAEEEESSNTYCYPTFAGDHHPLSAVLGLGLSEPSRSSFTAMRQGFGKGEEQSRDLSG